MFDKPFILVPYTSRSFLADLITPERAEELAGARTIVAAQIDRIRTPAREQFHRLWPGVRDPYVKADWNRLRARLCDLHVDVGAPSYVARSREELGRRLACLRAARDRATRSRAIAGWGLFLLYVVIGYLNGPYESWWPVSVLVGGIVAYLLSGVMVTRYLREVRFLLALFCHACGEPLTGGMDGERERDVMESGKCAHCQHILLDEPTEAPA